MKEGELERMADRIEEVLEGGGAPVRITGGTVTPYWVRFRADPRRGTESSSIGELADALALTLNTPVRVAQRDSTVSIEVERVGVSYSIDDLLARLESALSPYVAALGMTDEGAPLLVNLESEQGMHVLIEGEGRADLLTVVTESLTRWNHLLRGGWADDQIETLAREIADGRRKRRPVVVTLADGGDTPALRDVLAHGLAGGVHVILTTEYAGDGLRALFPCRIRGLGDGRFDVVAGDYRATFYTPTNGGKEVTTE